MQEGFKIRALEEKDDSQIAVVIRAAAVTPEFQTTYTQLETMIPEYCSMYAYYDKPRHQYFVLERDGVVKGGAGITPLTDAAEDICELQKMYFAKEVRGLGLGEEMLRHCLAYAREQEFKRCYLDTMELMLAAISLYKKHGFKELDEPMGNTGHNSCQRYFLLEL